MDIVSLYILNMFWSIGRASRRTGYDSVSRQHWLSVYKPNYNARFLLQQSSRAGHHPATTMSTITTNANHNNNEHYDNTREEEEVEVVLSMEDQIRNTVDHMIRVMPPRIVVKGKGNNNNEESSVEERI